MPMDSFIKDFAKACFVFWGIIGIFLIWYTHKINEFNDQKPKQEEDEAQISLSESPQEKEAQDC